MLESMTAYSSKNFKINDTDFTIEIKSLNSRFLDLKLKTPHVLNSFDIEIRNNIKKNLNRGYIECFIKINNYKNNIKINHENLKKYFKIYKEIIKNNKLNDEVKLSDILKTPDLIKFEELEFKNATLKKKLIPKLDLCIKDLISMQKKEGSEIEKTFTYYLNSISKELEKIEKGFKSNKKAYFKKLKENLENLISNKNLSEEKIITEAAIIAEKLDIAEEIQRLKSHIKMLKSTVKNKDTQVGRKLDFITQELNREANTICSKTNLDKIKTSAIEIKNLIEKIKEQVQNVK
jgi:uncharacterized protein (TIGR00255 family)